MKNQLAYYLIKKIIKVKYFLNFLKKSLKAALKNV